VARPPSVAAPASLLTGSRTLEDAAEILVQVPSAPADRRHARTKFLMTPETSVLEVEPAPLSRVPAFEIRGEVDVRLDCERPITGCVVVDRCDAPIRSIEFWLVRVETVPWVVEGGVREELPIVEMEVADGDVRRGTRVPFSALLPRLSATPTMLAVELSLEFEANLVLELETGQVFRGIVEVVLWRGDEGSRS